MNLQQLRKLESDNKKLTNKVNVLEGRLDEVNKRLDALFLLEKSNNELHVENHKKMKELEEKIEYKPSFLERLKNTFK